MGSRWTHSFPCTVGSCCGVYKHAACPHILINAAYGHGTALSVEVTCLEKVTPFHFSILPWLFPEPCPEITALDFAATLLSYLSAEAWGL